MKSINSFILTYLTDKVDTFLEKCNLSIVTQEEIESSNSPTIILKIETLLKVLPKQNTRLRWFHRSVPTNFHGTNHSNLTKLLHVFRKNDITLQLIL